jgi:hypothetical protein
MIKNLDLLAARQAQQIIKATIVDKQKAATEVENLVTKALGIVQENGIYAGLLYLYSRKEKEKEIARPVRLELLMLLPEIDGDPQLAEEVVAIRQNDADAESAAAARIALELLTTKICGKLEKLLLVKQLWEQTLIYARYGAKTQG